MFYKGRSPAPQHRAFAANFRRRKIPTLTQGRVIAGENCAEEAGAEDRGTPAAGSPSPFALPARAGSPFDVMF
jgi:hypothetical protein